LHKRAALRLSAHAEGHAPRHDRVFGWHCRGSTSPRAEAARGLWFVLERRVGPAALSL
jgi:hypothetical protein